MNLGILNAADSDEEVNLLPDDEIEAYDQEHGITRELIASYNSQGNKGALSYLTCFFDEGNGSYRFQNNYSRDNCLKEQHETIHRTN